MEARTHKLHTQAKNRVHNAHLAKIDPNKPNNVQQSFKKHTNITNKLDNIHSTNINSLD